MLRGRHTVKRGLDSAGALGSTGVGVGAGKVRAIFLASPT